MRAGTVPAEGKGGNMKQKTYLHWGVTITAAACAILVFYDTFFQDGVLFIFIEKLFGILKPVLYGLAMAYLLTPIVDFFDRLLRDRLGVKRAGLMRCLSILVTWLLALGLVYLLFSILIPELVASVSLLFSNLESYYRTIYIASGIWKQMGWSSILYLATLSSVDMSLYEAAAIDGAGRFRQMLSVTLPALVPIIAVQLIMRMGHIMGEGHQKTILLYNEMTWEVSDIVSSYVYRRGLKNNDYSFGAAVDLFNSLVNVIILCSANYFSKHVVKESLW